MVQFGITLSPIPNLKRIGGQDLLCFQLFTFASVRQWLILSDISRSLHHLWINYVSLLLFIWHLFHHPSRIFTVHPFVFCSWICSVNSPFSLPFSHSCHRKCQAQVWKWQKKRKENQILNIHWGRICVLQKSLTIHFEYILFFERIVMVVMASRGVVGLSHIQMSAVPAGSI